jgi:hypothetical protein
MCFAADAAVRDARRVGWQAGFSMLASELELPTNVLDSIPNGVLFYPCSGADFTVPLIAFSNRVTNFWFVDTGYTDDCLKEEITATRPELSCLLIRQDRKFWNPAAIPRSVWPEVQQRRYPWIEPLVCTDRYVQRRSGNIVTVNRRRGYGVACLRKREFESIAVFFYRGDSPVNGESSSGTLWLRENGINLFGEVIARMKPSGLIVTDGSNCSGGTLKPLRQCHRKSGNASLQKLDFQTRSGHYLRHVGRLNNRYGPTLVWRIESMKGNS